MKNFRISIVASVVIAVVLFSCGKFQKGYDCTGITPTYNNDIKAIYDSKCATSGCHSASHHAAGIDLSSYTGATAANNDDMLGAVEHKSGYSSMPQGGSKLSDSDIKKMYCWMQNNKPM